MKKPCWLKRATQVPYQINASSILCLYLEILTRVSFSSSTFLLTSCWSFLYSTMMFTYASKGVSFSQHPPHSTGSFLASSLLSIPQCPAPPPLDTTGTGCGERVTKHVSSRIRLAGIPTPAPSQLAVWPYTSDLSTLHLGSSSVQWE
jgi:hypothetical protein